MKSTMTAGEARTYAQGRGQVLNTTTGKIGKLVDWLPGRYCKVFTHYEQIGAVKMPIFETWHKYNTEKHSGCSECGAEGKDHATTCSARMGDDAGQPAGCL